MSDLIISPPQSERPLAEVQEERYVGLAGDVDKLVMPFIKVPENPPASILAQAPKIQGEIETNVANIYAITRVLREYRMPESMGLLGETAGNSRTGQIEMRSGLTIIGEPAWQTYREGMDEICSAVNGALKLRHEQLSGVVEDVVNTLSFFHTFKEGQTMEDPKLVMPGERVLTATDEERNLRLIDETSKNNEADGKAMTLLLQVSGQLGRVRGGNATGEWDVSWLSPEQRADLLHSYAQAVKKVLVYHGQIDECRTNRIIEATHRQLQPEVQFAMLDREQPVYVVRPPRPRIILAGVGGNDRVTSQQNEVER